MAALEHEQAMEMPVTKEGAIVQPLFVLDELSAVLLDQPLMRDLLCQLIIVLFRVACNVIDEVKEEVHHVNTISTLARAVVLWPLALLFLAKQDVIDQK